MSTMKILLLYRDSCDRDIKSSVVSGGGEQFCKLIYKNFDVVVSVKLFSKMTKSEFIRNDIASDFFKTDYVGNIYVFLDKEDVVKLTELYIYLKECKTNKMYNI